MDIFKVPQEGVTKNMRRQAKAVNFGILYGISSYGLAEDLGIPVKEAKEFINKYFDTYPGVRDYMDKEIETANKNGYVKTIMNRKRVIDELKSTNYMIRNMGERMALNTPVQGSASDILKKAMIEIDEIFEKENIDTELLIHISSVLNLSPASFFEDITPSVMQNGTKNILVGRDNNGNISTNECQDKLEDAMIEIKHLKAVIEGKDKLLEEKERLINVLMNK